MGKENLERRVEERTRELQKSGEELSEQVARSVQLEGRLLARERSFMAHFWSSNWHLAAI
jgi:C4-dicarboxylate-specific signal transduction histidine kinase